MLKQQKGITLIALVITIIVLLTLAALAIIMLGDEDNAPNTNTNNETEVKAIEDIVKGKDEVGKQATLNISKFYEEKYVDNKTTLTFDTIQKAVTAAGNEGETDGVVEQTGITVSVIEDNEIKIVYDADESYYSTGTVETDGTITWVYTRGN